MNPFLHTAAGAELETAWREGARALREGRPAEARDLFNRIAAAGRATPAVWLGVAMAHRALGDEAGAHAALKQGLELDPHDIRALMMTADLHAAAGDDRAANAYYDAVVKVARAAGGVEPALQAEVSRAHQMTRQFSAAYEAHLLKELADRSLDRPEARRFRQSLDLLLGRSEIYLQQPRHYYFPELPNIGYADRAAFPWMDRVEAATDDIRAELLRVLEEDDSVFTPYLQAEPNRPRLGGNPLTGNPAWSAFYLWKAGAPVAENLARCPSVMPALAEAPLCRIPGRTPSVLFSLLRPGAHIAPHHGFTNARFVCHLPLIVPEGCAMRVGAETRAWTEGKACIFDDSVEHEAWNRHPDRLRVVMIFDIWRPELNETERELVGGLLQAVDSYGGAPAWDS